MYMYVSMYVCIHIYIYIYIYILHGRDAEGGGLLQRESAEPKTDNKHPNTTAHNCLFVVCSLQKLYKNKQNRQQRHN